VRRKPSTSLAGNDTRVRSTSVRSVAGTLLCCTCLALAGLPRTAPPASMRALFSSLRITSTFSLIGSIVGEYVAGGRQGLGYELITAKRSIDAALVMAITLVATVTGGVVFLATAGVERLVLSRRGPMNL
jgi:ABC-type nitrate/sulfonate/bicarbonate transport system permease component